MQSRSRASHQITDRPERHGRYASTRRNRTLAWQGEADYRSQTKELSRRVAKAKRAHCGYNFYVCSINSRLGPASFLCMCTMKAVPNSGVARFKIGMDTN